MTLNGCGCKESPEGELIFPKVILSKLYVTHRESELLLQNIAC